MNRFAAAYRLRNGQSRVLALDNCIDFLDHPGIFDSAAENFVHDLAQKDAANNVGHAAPPSVTGEPGKGIQCENTPSGHTVV